MLRLNGLLESEKRLVLRTYGAILACIALSFSAMIARFYCC